MKKFYVFLALGAMALAGCATAGKDVKKDPTDSVYTPKPVSAVFTARPNSTTKVDYDTAGKFASITSTGTAPVAGNNSASIEQAVSVATMRAKRNLVEFLANDLQTTRSLKVLSHTVQRGLENISNGAEQDLVVKDSDFDENGNAVAGTGEAASTTDNQNSQRIAETLRETITANSRQLLRGVLVVNQQLDAAGRTVQVEVKADVKSIEAAKDLRKLMD